MKKLSKSEIPISKKKSYLGKKRRKRQKFTESSCRIRPPGSFTAVIFGFRNKDKEKANEIGSIVWHYLNGVKTKEQIHRSNILQR